MGVTNLELIKSPVDLPRKLPKSGIFRLILAPASGAFKPFANSPVSIVLFFLPQSAQMKIERFFKAGILASALVFAITSVNAQDRAEDRSDRREDVRDRAEDRRDKREDVRDTQHEGGRRDKLEDRRDRREDVRDFAEDRRDKREDVGDRNENRHDRKENLRDRREKIRDKRH